ncbi:MAG TPA: hypothetical protein VK933_03405 [Longimicrobiales bacterium]|nr:hypothetical protein [Longimicrobiales bacterium]
MMRRRRSGAALTMTLLAIIVLDCIVLGSLYLALQEARIGGNHSAVLQLRLDAESGIRRALGLWTLEIDSMPAATGQRLTFDTLATGGALVHAERLDDRLFLLESAAFEQSPRFGRAAARMLVAPPALAVGVDPAPAPLSSSASVHVTSTGVVISAVPAGCAAAPTPHAVLAPQFSVTIAPGASVDAPGGAVGPDPLIHTFGRLLALAPPHTVASGDTAITARHSGVLIVPGNLRVTPGAAVSGLLVASGSVQIDAGAVVAGAVHAAGLLTVAGSSTWDPCTVKAAISAAGLDRPRPAAGRAWLPAF